MNCEKFWCFAFATLLLLQCGEKKLQEASESVATGSHEIITLLKEAGLNNVESIIFDSLDNVFYATNGVDYSCNSAEGFVSRVSSNGEMLDLRWISQLHRPTGMAIHDKLLYVVDVCELLIIDSSKGEIVERIPAPAQDLGLNDVAIDHHGQVFISSSFTHSIYTVSSGSLTPWVTDTTKLKWANGLAISGEELIVGGLYLHSIDIHTRMIKQIKTDTLSDFDGLVSDGYGGYYLTAIDNGLWHIDSDNRLSELIPKSEYFADLDFVRQDNAIYVARGNHTLKEYFISKIILKATGTEK